MAKVSGGAIRLIDKDGDPLDDGNGFNVVSFMHWLVFAKGSINSVLLALFCL